MDYGKLIIETLKQYNNSLKEQLDLATTLKEIYCLNGKAEAITEIANLIQQKLSDATRDGYIKFGNDLQQFFPPGFHGSN